jgi:hypothetical protein
MRRALPLFVIWTTLAHASPGATAVDAGEFEVIDWVMAPLVASGTLIAMATGGIALLQEESDSVRITGLALGLTGLFAGPGAGVGIWGAIRGHEGSTIRAIGAGFIATIAVGAMVAAPYHEDEVPSWLALPILAAGAGAATWAYADSMRPEPEGRATLAPFITRTDTSLTYGLQWFTTTF